MKHKDRLFFGISFCLLVMEGLAANAIRVNAPQKELATPEVVTPTLRLTTSIQSTNKNTTTAATRSNVTILNPDPPALTSSKEQKPEVTPPVSSNQVSLASGKPNVTSELSKEEEKEKNEETTTMTIIQLMETTVVTTKDLDTDSELGRSSDDGEGQIASKNENEKPKEAATPESDNEIAAEDLATVSGGAGDIKQDIDDAMGKRNEISDDKAKDIKKTITEPHIDFEQSEDSNFMSFVVIGGLLVFCLYLLQHNKKKILGLIFEGRSNGSSRRGGNVRYRRLSQRDDDSYHGEEIIY